MPDTAAPAAIFSARDKTTAQRWARCQPGAPRLPGEAAAALLERADAALYASKRAGRNRVTGASTLEKAA